MKQVTIPQDCGVDPKISEVITLTEEQQEEFYCVRDPALSRKSLYWTHTLEKCVSWEMIRPYARAAGMLLPINLS